MNDTEDRPGELAEPDGDAQAATSPDTPAGRRCSREQAPMDAGRHTGRPRPGAGPIVVTARTACLIGGTPPPTRPTIGGTAA